jgi:signal transduction histidine kinase
MTDALTSFLTGYFRFNLHGLLNVVAGTLDLVVGLIVLSKSPKSRLHQSFFLFTASSGIWLLCFGMMSLTRDIANAGVWLRVSYIAGVPFISPCVYLFSAYWTKESGFQKTAVLGFIFAAVMVIPVTFFYDSFFFIKEFSSWRYPRVNGTAWSWVCMGAMLAQFFTYALMAFRNFYVGWKTSPSHHERILYRSVFFAFLIAYSASLDFAVTAGFNFYPYGYISLSLFLYFLSYVIIRHRLLDINIALKKISLIILVYGILFSVTIPFLLILLNREPLLLLGNPVWSVLFVGGFLGVWLSFGPFLYAYLVRNHFWLRNKLSTGIAHELKSPISSILGSVEMMKDRLTEKRFDRDSVIEYAGMIERNAERLNVFVQDLLSLAKIQEDVPVDLEKTSCDLGLVVEEVIESYRGQLEQKNINVVRNNALDRPVSADCERIRQVISNLLSNAIKFSYQNSSLNIDITKKGGYALVSIVDSGRGIPQHLQEKIFERFYQIDPNIKGSGIGLAIAKAWVEAHGGRIWAESEGEGKGTKVTFTVPVE